ncbi:Trm112 family protein [Chrysiogenes arsenatis]|uniref:Trm112 family protein n=1 Tax=Chrysiogenes arsenatis TaxID=309797 RepID=UPI003CCD729D
MTEHFVKKFPDYCPVCKASLRYAKRDLEKQALVCPNCLKIIRLESLPHESRTHKSIH